MKRLSDFLKQQKMSLTKRAPSEETEFTTRKSLGASELASLAVKLNTWALVNGQPLLRNLNWNVLRTCVFIFSLSFVFANVTSTMAAQSSFKVFNKSKKTNATVAENGATAYMASGSALAGRSSSSAIKETILSRNLFNSDGTLAPEADKDLGKKSADLDFSKVQCVKEKLPVEILGTIYTGSQTDSVVIIKDSKIPDADIYQVGKAIIDYEDIEVSRIGQGTVEFRKGDTKICFDLTGREKDTIASGVAPSMPKPEATETIEIGDEEMKNLLGPELARGMNEAKLIPIPATNGVGIQGFQILAIVPGSVFDRIKLQNEDMLLEVNGQSLKDPVQGYRLIEALQQQREININFTRKGDPMVRKVRVK